MLDEQAELNAYLARNLEKEEKSTFDLLLQWWNASGKTTYPMLAKVARSMLCIPAVSAIYKSRFFSAGIVMSKARNSLKPSML
ncbi:hAT family C-terminal dimerization region [Phytophthora infestans]|uniref:HAT family C-terminal dimerization region n=1 Tax=Phytophthora infestans TaxID=4787 RepID=A0A833S0L4_PHYIN|nr:hAT family C-terminal dimerization region [Phytophthora infestans]KAF4133408.1 hAT family C-terminal dimerization region [Phytophthora infestans]KAF4136630.1 hAT family C-terminal dimerization region [Phytophthora infestans]